MIDVSCSVDTPSRHIPQVPSRGPPPLYATILNIERGSVLWIAPSLPIDISRKGKINNSEHSSGERDRAPATTHKKGAA